MAHGGPHDAILLSEGDSPNLRSSRAQVPYRGPVSRSVNHAAEDGPEARGSHQADEITHTHPISGARMLARQLAVGLVPLALACASPEPSPSVPDLAVIRSQVDSIWAQYKVAAVAGDADALARLYTDNAQIVELGLPTTQGNAAIRSLIAGVLGNVRILESDIRPESTEMLGDRVLQMGTYRDVVQPVGQPVQLAFGRFAVVLRQDAAGAWRVDRLVAFPDSTVARAAGQ